MVATPDFAYPLLILSIPNAQSWLSWVSESSECFIIAYVFNVFISL